MSNKERKLVEIKRKNLYKIFSFFLLIIFCLTIFAFLTFSYYISSYQKRLESEYSLSLSYIGDHIDNMFYELYQTTAMLSLDSDLIDIMRQNDLYEMSDYIKITNSINALIKLRISKSIIDNAFILDETNSTIISGNGLFSMDYFFGEVCQYEQYPRQFWNNIDNSKKQSYILQPTKVTSSYINIHETTIIPFIQYSIGSNVSSNPLIINIRENLIYDMLQKHKITENSILMIIDEEGRVLSSTDRDKMFEPISDTTFTSSLANLSDRVFRTQLYGTDYLTINHTSSNYLLGNLIYIACVPISDLQKELSNIRNTVLMVGIICLIGSMILAFVLSKKLYSPIEKLIAILESGRDKSTTLVDVNNEFDYLSENIKSILDNNENLAKALSSSIPNMTEQSFVRLIDGQSNYPEESISNTPLNMNIFKKNAFLVCIVNFHYYEDFYIHFNVAEQSLVTNNMARVFENILQNDYTVFILKHQKKQDMHHFKCIR